MKGNVIVGQSGGPTSVINSSLAGVFKTAKDRGANKIFGMCNGIKGLLDEKYVDLTDKLNSTMAIDLLKRTPSSALGSCRFKLPDVGKDKETYENFVNSRKNAYALCFDGDDVTIDRVTYGSESDDAEQARELFDALRKLDELGAKRVYARMPHKDGVAMAVYNRLIRAAAFRIIDLKKPFTIGLTGATGAGKGHICKELEALGFNIIYSDLVAREVVQKGSPLLDKLADEFGADILKDGELDRALLAERAFVDKSQTAKLNSIMHPAIISRCEELAHGLTVLDAPQLFEAHAEDKCYKIVAVTAPKELRAQRIIARDGITAKQAEQRISVQFDDEYYINHSDYVIINDGREIKTQINQILAKIF